MQTIFFGRLVAYKGLDHSIRAVAHAKQAGADIRLRIIGNGPELDKLKALTAELALQDEVSFTPAMPYAQCLGALQEADVLLATPLSSDTPRSLFDAMSQGLATAAYATPYYNDFVQTGAVTTTPWNDPKSLGNELARIHTARDALVTMSARATEFARHNTQADWLRNRVQWTIDAL